MAPLMLTLEAEPAHTEPAHTEPKACRRIATALAEYEEDPEVLARRAMQIAADVCVFTNDQLTVEVIEG